MIAIVAKHLIKLDCLDTYHARAQELAEASQKEAGCVFYHSVQSETDPREHVFMECWKDQAAIDFHNATEHFTRIVPQFAALFDGAEDVKFYNVNI